MEATEKEASSYAAASAAASSRVVGNPVSTLSSLPAHIRWATNVCICNGLILYEMHNVLAVHISICCSYSTLYTDNSCMYNKHATGAPICAISADGERVPADSTGCGPPQCKSFLYSTVCGIVSTTAAASCAGAARGAGQRCCVTATCTQVIHMTAIPMQFLQHNSTVVLLHLIVLALACVGLHHQRCRLQLLAVTQIRRQLAPAKPEAPFASQRH